MEKKQRNMAKIGFAAFLGLLLTLPLAILEFTFNGAGHTTGYVALFGFLWILATFLSLMFVLLVQTIQSRSYAKPFQLALEVAGLIAGIMIWGSIIGNQLPCFLGVPNCD